MENYFIEVTLPGYQGEQLYLLGIEGERAPVSTKENYIRGVESYAHYFPGRGVLRHGELICEEKDMVYGEKVKEFDPSIEAFINLITGNGWPL